MSKPSFSDIFGMCLSSDEMSLIRDCPIEKCSLDTDVRSLSIEIASEVYIERELQLNIQNSLKDV